LLRPRPQAGEVAARVGFAEALAADDLAAEDLLDVRLLLPGRAVHDQCWGEQAHPQPAEDDRRARVRHLLLVDRLHDRGRAAAAGLPGPRQLQPAALVEPALPIPLQLGVVVFAVATHPAVAPLGREVDPEPGADLLPKGLFLSSEAEIHGSEVIKKGDK